MAAAAPLRKLLLHLRIGVNPQPLPVPLLYRLAPQLRQQPPPAVAPPEDPTDPTPSCPNPNLRDHLFSFHPAMHIYPSLVDLGSDRGGAREDGDEDGAEVWADSVKKKRKRKMNKHKLRKLRKRLRRQT